MGDNASFNINNDEIFKVDGILKRGFSIDKKGKIIEGHLPGYDHEGRSAIEMHTFHSKTCNRDCEKEDPKWYELLAWCSPNNVAAVDAVWSFFSGEETECKKLRTAVKKCNDKNCDKSQYGYNTCTHCLKQAIKKPDIKTNKCGQIYPVRETKKCSYSTKGDSYNDSAKNMASRWKDWCQKRKKDNKRIKPKTTYLGGKLGDIISKDSGSECDRTGYTAINGYIQPHRTRGLYYQESDFTNDEDIKEGRKVKDLVYAPDDGERQAKNSWISPCEWECEHEDGCSKQNDAHGGEWVRNCTDKKCEIREGTALLGADGWDWNGQYIESPSGNTTPTSYLKSYLDNQCKATSEHLTPPPGTIGESPPKWFHHRGVNPKITPTGTIFDDWTSWGGIYPHTSSNLVGYGADGKWGSEGSQFASKEKPYKYPQNTFFHTMSPLSIMGVKTYIDLKDNHADDVGGSSFIEIDEKNDLSRNYLLTNKKSDNRDNYRPRHVQTFMTSCTHGGGDGKIDSLGSFPDLVRNKLFFDTEQKTTSLYPSELSSQTNNKDIDVEELTDNPEGVIYAKGEKPEVAKGGILRGCMRRKNDYEAKNILNCCIMGEPIKKSYNKLRNLEDGSGELEYTCPSKYCRDIDISDGIESKKKGNSNYRNCLSGGAMTTNRGNDNQAKNDPYCYKMSKNCVDIGEEICKKLHNDPKINELCDAWMTIQETKAGEILKGKCTWFFDDVDVKNILFKKGPVKDLTEKEKLIIKRLYETLNNDRCQKTIRSLVDNNSSSINLKNFCKNSVEEAYGKCLPRDNSSSDKKVNTSATPDEIETCKNKQDDPNECEKTKDCVFEFKDGTGKEYKQSDPGVVKYYRKTFKGSLLSSEINDHDNNLEGKELVKLLRQSNIHRFNEEEGIGADICGCFMGNKSNDYNNWYKRNKLLDITKDDVLEDIRIGETEKCWIKECINSNFVGDTGNIASRECPNVFKCIQRQNLEIDARGIPPITMLRRIKAGIQECNFKTTDSEINQNVGDIMLNKNLQDTDEAKKVAKTVTGMTDNIDDILSNLDSEIDDVTDTGNVQTVIRSQKRSRSESNTKIAIFVLGLIIIIILLIFLIL